MRTPRTDRIAIPDDPARIGVAVRLRSVAPPKQARSRATLARILEAAETLIAEKGLADVSIPEIVRRAGSSVGGFYARFRDKDELLRALEERFLGEVRMLLDELADPGRWEDAPVTTIARACVAKMVEVFRGRRRLIAAFMARAAHDADLRGELVSFREEASNRFVQLLRGRHDRFAHPDPELAIDLGIQFAFALMHHSVLFGEVRAAGRVLSDGELARELTRQILGYIGYHDARAGA